MLPSASSYRFLRPPCWIQHACYVIMIMIYIYYYRIYIFARVNIDDLLFCFGSRKKWWESNVLKTPMKYNDLHICSFFSLTECDQNYMQMINLKKLLGCWPFQIIQNFRNNSRSCAIFIFNKTCRSSLRTVNVLYLFLNVRIPCATSIYSSCGLTIAR